MKYKALIVDDNHMQIKSLLAYVNWEKFAIDEIKIAHNGSEGLEIFFEFNPHLIITDVVMQEMSGIEMANEIRKVSNRTQFIFISCYEDFVFLKKAMENDIVSYVLKPLKPELLDEAIRKAIDRIKSLEHHDAINNLLQESLDLYRQNFFYKLIFSKYPERGQMEVDIHNLNLDKFNVFIFAKIDVICVRQIDIYNLLNLTEKEMFSEIMGMFIIENEGRMVAIFMSVSGSPSEFKEKVKCTVERYRSLVNADYNLNLNIGLSQVHDSLLEANVMLEEATNALENNLSFDASGVHIYNDLIYANSDYHLLELKEELSNLLYGSDQGQVDAFIDKFFPTTDAVSIYPVKSFCIHVFTLLQLILSERNMLDDEVLTIFSGIWNKVNMQNSITKAKEWFLNTLESVLQVIFTKDKESHEKLVQDIDEMIKLHYKSLKNVGQIATSLFVSESYARKIYKKYTGKTIFEKLFVTRMENAKMLLSKQKMTVQTVSELVGYKSKSSFLEAFKRYTGYLPVDYAKLFGKKNTEDKE